MARYPPTTPTPTPTATPTATQVARYRGQLSEAEAFQREALQLWQAAGDRGGAAAALHELGVLQLRRADWAAARTLLTQA